MVRRDGPDGTTWLTFDRPDRLNAFTAAGYRELREALDACAASPEVRVVVLTGAGRAFSAGADRSLLDGSADTAEAGQEFRALLEALAAFAKPLIAAVNGPAVGFGCTMLLYADVVLVAASARLRLPFTALGITPEAGSSALALARMRPAEARWAMLSSEWIDSATAVSSGLALQAVDDHLLLDRAAAMAATLAALDPESVAETKALLTFGGAALARAAVDRETETMARLARRRRSQGAGDGHPPSP